MSRTEILDLVAEGPAMGITASRIPADSQATLDALLAEHRLYAHQYVGVSLISLI